LIDETLNLNESSKSILRLWARILREKHRKENYDDDEIFKDPLLLIEWNEAGIAARTAVNPMFTKNALLTRMYINITSLRIDCAIHYIMQ
jgi:hypothetical protein